MLAVLVLGLAGAVALRLVVARLIVRPVVAVRDRLVAVAGGDLTQRVEVSSTDEVGQMAEALNRATESLRTTVSSTGRMTRVRSTAGGVGAGMDRTVGMTVVASLARAMAAGTAVEDELDRVARASGHE